MAIPAYLWMTDEKGTKIIGSANVTGREGSIEIHGFNHSIFLPTEMTSGKVTATREHSPFSFDKEIDISSPTLYRAVTTGQTLQSAVIKLYHINDTGQEAEYLSIVMEDVNIISLGSVMYDIKSFYGESRNHLELVEMVYKKITWCYLDGNLIHSENWNSRVTA